MSNVEKINEQDNILEVSHLKKYFSIKGGFFGGETGSVKAVDDVSFTINKGEKLVAVIAIGYGKTQGTLHKSKSIEQVSNISSSTP